MPDTDMPLALRKALSTLTPSECRSIVRWLELDAKPLQKITAVIGVRATKG
jgi:hypothetical protein